jgi:hypothetical protein
LLGDGLLVVGIDLCEGNGILTGVFGREAFVYRSDCLARTTPVGVDLNMSVSNMVDGGGVCYVQSMTTPLEEASRDLSWAGDWISTSLDMF